jgi:hypothetical protein
MPTAATQATWRSEQQLAIIAARCHVLYQTRCLLGPMFLILIGGAGDHARDSRTMRRLAGDAGKPVTTERCAVMLKPYG